MSETDKHRDAVVRIIQAHGLSSDARDSILYHVDQAIICAKHDDRENCKKSTLDLLALHATYANELVLRLRQV